MAQLKKKLLTSYTLPTIDAINAITSRGFPKTLPVGSYIYSVQKYPGDIDIREDLTEVGTPLEAIKKIILDIQKVVRKIQKDPNAYFADFKAGADNAFKLPEDPSQYPAFIEQLHSYNLISQDIYEEWMDFVNTGDVQSFIDDVSKHYILRWGPDEVLQGYKVLPGMSQEIEEEYVEDSEDEDGEPEIVSSGGKRKKYLIDAVQDPEIVKVDMWYWLEERFVELSNFFILGVQSSPDAPVERVNLEQGEYIDAIKHDIQKYLSEYYFNPFKSLKRVWVLAVAMGDVPTVKLLNERLINSGMSITYQVIGDLKALRDMIKNMYNPPFDKMAIVTENMKTRLSAVFEFNLPSGIFSEIQDLTELLMDKGYGDERKMIPALTALESIITQLSGVLNTQALFFGKSVGLIPTPAQYL